MVFQDLMGEKFGRLTVLYQSDNKGKHACWVCRCKCGSTVVTLAHLLKSGKTKSCGCLRKEVAYNQSNYPNMDKRDRLTYLNYIGQVSRKYLLSEDTIRNMMDVQRGCCAICEGTLDSGAYGMHIDHDHSTGKVRGLLCKNCNQGIGLLKEDTDILLTAIQYLDKGGLYGYNC